MAMYILEKKQLNTCIGRSDNFFATNKSSLTTASRATLSLNNFLKKNKNLSVTIEGHADEEYRI